MVTAPAGGTLKRSTARRGRARSFCSKLACVIPLVLGVLGACAGEGAATPPASANGHNPFTSWLASSRHDLQGTLVEVAYAGPQSALLPCLTFSGGTDPWAAQFALQAALGDAMPPSGSTEDFNLSPAQVLTVLKTVATFAPAPPVPKGMVGFYAVQMTRQRVAAVVVGYLPGKAALESLAAVLPTQATRAAVVNLMADIYP